MKLAFLSLLVALPLFAADLDFKERFADPVSRDRALESLIPGTRDWFFYHALDQQLSGRTVDFAKTMADWKAANDSSIRPVVLDGYETLVTRELLLRYESDPQKNLAALIERFDLKFDASRPDAREVEKLPSVLDPQLITHGAFSHAAALKYPHAPWRARQPHQLLRDLDDVENFSDEQVRYVLTETSRSDYPGVTALVSRGLALKNPINFGDTPFHEQLTLAQLEELVVSHPKLKSDFKFVPLYLAKLRSHSEAEFLRDPALHAAYLDKCRVFALSLPPSQVSLRAHILYHHLRLQRELGNYPLNDFIAYISIPRDHHPILRDRARENLKYPMLSVNYSDATGCAPIGSDEELVEDYLLHFLGKSDTSETFGPYLEVQALEKLHARARLLAGGDPNRWGRKLDPGDFAKLLEETRVDFAPGQPDRYDSDSNVSLDLELKNTPKLLIRIYQLDLPSILERQGREPGPDFDLDGLVPHHSRSITFTQAPLVVHRESIDLPELSGPGAWIVEFVADGEACRALLRKGSLTPYVQRDADGQSIRVFDENNRPVTKVSFALGPVGTVFKPDKSGVIRVPNSEFSRSTQGVLSSDSLAQILRIDERSDDFKLDTRIHLDREQLLADSRAHARLQVKLSNHGHAIPLDRIEDASLTLSAKLIGGVTTEHVIADDLEITPAFEVPFQVPADTLELTLKLAGTIIPRDNSDPVKLESSSSFSFNSLLKGHFTSANFTRTPQGYVLEVRGRNGEALANRAINFTFLHNDFSGSTEINTRLRSDEQGRIRLGLLEDLRLVAASYDGRDLATLDRSDLSPSTRLSSEIRVAANEVIRLPLDAPFDRSTFSFVELDLRQRPRVDHADKLVTEGKQLVLNNLTPGSYRLRTPQNEVRIEIESTPASGDLFISPTRIAPRVLPAYPVVTEIRAENDQLLIETTDASPATRIHVVGSRYIHPWNHWQALAPFPSPKPPILTPGFETNAFLTERRLDSEMRYILERRGARTFPGSMLPRPGILAQRWSQEDIDSAVLPPLDGADGKTSRKASPRRQSIGESDPFSGHGGSSGSNTPDFLDYLSRRSELHYDLTPDGDGVLRLPLATFDGCQIIQVVVTDRGSLNRQAFALPQSSIPLRDRRLSHPLDPEKHHIGTRSAAALAKGAEASITNILDADWRAFTTLTEAHEFLYGALGDEKLRAMSFLLSWPEIDEEAKLAHWSEHASHEFHLFLARKDPAFFEKHVKALLEKKLEPTFIDDFLLRRDLTPYLRPFAWNRLNAAEKALLAIGARTLVRPEAPANEAQAEFQKRIAAELQHRWELESPTPEQQTKLFSQTLRGTDLATEDSLGLARRNASPLGGPTTQSAGATLILQKLKNIIIPVIDFEDTSIQEAIDFLRIRSIELDTWEMNPDFKGINFVIRQPRGDGGDFGAARIKQLRLRNVPLAEALDYICESTRMRWSTDDFAVTIKPATEVGEDLFTRTFNVPPDFMERIIGGTGGKRMSFVEALKANGVKFPPDASAQFYASNNTLMIRNTPTNLDMVESIISAVHDNNWTEEEDSAAFIDPFAAPATVLPPINDGADFLSPPELPNPVAKPFYARPSWSSKRGQTRLWLPSNYYRHSGSTNESLIPLNPFWLDLAQWGGNGPFISPHFNSCTHSVSDALMCLAMLDLPFKAERPEVKVDGSALTVKARDAMLLFYKDTRETDKIAPDAPLLVRQTFHRLDDRFRIDAGRKIENTITGDFQTGVAYGASLVVTNPSGAGRRIDVLAQIPAGAIPIAAKPPTLSETRELAPYGVLTFELAFYFPAPGDFAVYPMHVAENDTILASAPAKTLRVLSDPIEEDRASWTSIAGDGSDDEVLDHLQSANLHSTNLDLIRWRLQDRVFFAKATAILRERLHSIQDVNAYGFLHADVPSIRTWLENSQVRLEVGASLQSPLLTIDPVEHLDWQSLEFDPLVNPRIHSFGDNPRLSFETARQHYESYLDQLSWKAELSAEDQLHLSWFLFLQDRIEEAIARFEKVESNKLSTKLSYDYLQALTHFHRAEPNKSREIAAKHQHLPPGPWRERFDAVLAQADEIGALAQPQVEQKAITEKAEPTLEIALNPDGKLRLTHQRLNQADLKLYHVDLEMLFSKNPFLYDTDDLPGTRPNLIRQVALEGNETVLELPEEFRRGNVLIAADAGSTKALQILDSQAIKLEHRKVDTTLQVFDAESRTPLSACYVKVYREQNGEPVFLKDGYTDLRGKFDYLTLTDGESPPSGDIAIFVDHPKKGSRTLIIER
ncbi:hypothetical protein ACFQY0_20115 [Haloferula chungangensis]|uniref:Uncharacterized protein n=1 Tax=Haloferula chungangensis TaxID=1048331 RepID=A0ABW2LDU7_9BACT